MKDLAEKIALVTGASRGIGRAISERLAREGVRVVMIASTPADLEAAAKSIRQNNGRVEPFVCNLKDTPPFLALLKKIEQKVAPIDILVNNVGAGTLKPFSKTTVEILRAIRRNQREVIFPWPLAVLIRLYQMSPELAHGLMKMTGLFRPAMS